MSSSACERMRCALHEYQRGLLAAEPAAELEAHLQGCAECRAIDAEERVLSELLLTRLPRRAAPTALKMKLMELAAPQAPTPMPARSRPKALLPWATSILSMGVAALALLWPRAPHGPDQQLVSEAVNDHLRVLYATQPLEIVSAGIHDVKPWFAGRLDFAPDVAFSGNAEFPLVGGAVGLLVDRKAATFVFKHRLHTLSLFVFRADHLVWPDGPAQRVGATQAQSAQLHGFRVLLWRTGELGHALVSDAESATLLHLATELTR